MTTPNVTLVNKISAADLLGKVGKFVRENIEVGERCKAFGVAGVCEAIETGTSTFGEWTRYVGDFQAVNYVTGDVYRSERAHVPTVLSAILERDLGALKTGEVKENKHSSTYPLSTSAEFAFSVDIVRNPDDEESGAVSYEYVTTPKTQIAANDRISHLTGLLGVETPTALEAKPAAKKAAK